MEAALIYYFRAPDAAVALARGRLLRQEARIDPGKRLGQGPRESQHEKRKMQLDAAIARLTAALDRLEIVTAPLAQARNQAKKDAAELARLNQEREVLLARIAELEEESRALAGVTEEVEDRLDSAVA